MPNRNTHTRLNAYQIMWLFVLFDLPTKTKKEKQIYTRFRKNLKKDGFTMMQYSVYIRHCASAESGQVHIRRVMGWLPPKGQISIVQITDKQYGRIINLWGNKKEAMREAPHQLELF